MLIPALALAAVIGGGAYACLSIIAAHYSLYLPSYHPLASLIGYEAGPLILFIASASAFAWAKARGWRRMQEQRRMSSLDPAFALSRGFHALETQARGPSDLERLLGLSIRLSLIAMPYWLDWPQPEAWGTALIITGWVRRLLWRPC